MLVLIVNIGSTSFKYKVFDMPSERVMATGKIERVGTEDCPCSFTSADARSASEVRRISSFEEALSYVLGVLTNPPHRVLASLEDLGAVAFKVPHARKYSGAQLLSPEVVQAINDYGFIIPAHNPPYARAIEDFRKVLPDVPLVALFETAFHQTMPEVAFTYSIPYEVAKKHDIRRFGFHGASHRYMTERYAELAGKPLEAVNLITCHLGGSSSLTAVKNGRCLENSFGFSSQSGIPSSTRCGEIDPYTVPFLVHDCGFSFEEACELLAKRGGMLGISGISGEMRDLERAAEEGSERAQLAIDVFVHAVKKCIGAYLALLVATEAIVFSGGIGEGSPEIRRKICGDLTHLGIHLDEEKNAVCVAQEQMVSPDDSPIKIWVIPANEEIILAREAYGLVVKRQSPVTD